MNIGELDSPENEYTRRAYQLQLLDKAEKDNTILYLPTGSGKTYIAVMLIRRLAHSLPNESGTLDGKRTIFLVQTISLVDQQSEYMERLLPYKVGRYSGDASVDFWEESNWIQEIKNNQILTMTSQIFLHMLLHKYIKLEQCNLIIFDECHAAVNDHPMRQIMQQFMTCPENMRPRILGLTATLLNSNCKLTQVRNELHALETTFHSKIATVDTLDEVTLYSTNPTEGFSRYRDCASEPCKKASDTVRMMIEKLIFNLNKCSDLLKKVKSNKTGLGVLLNQNDGNNKMCNFIREIQVHLDDLGLYPAQVAVESQILDLKRYQKHCDDNDAALYLNIAMTSLHKMKKYVEDIMSPYEDFEKIRLFCKDKVLKLFDILKHYDRSKLTFCSIIFVRRRFTAKILYYVLKKLSDVPVFSFLKPNFIVGFNNNPHNLTREGLFIRKMNKQVMADFVEKKVNVLIASSVIEEGIDVPLCNLIVMFDPVTNYRAYVQSKGRARHRESSFVIMTAEGDSTSLSKLILFRDIEAVLKETLIGKTDCRDAPTKEEIERSYQQELEPYVVNKPNGGVATMLSAISLVNRYCLSLPQDKFTELGAYWYIQINREEIFVNNAYRVNLELPTVSQLRDVIYGPWMPNRKLAKRAVALKTVKMLHQIGELNDNLMPVELNELPTNSDFLFKHWPTEEETPLGFEPNDEMNKMPKPGTKKFLRLHRKECPTVFSKCEPKPDNDSHYIHVIEFEPAFEKSILKDLSSSVFYDLIQSKHTFAVLSRKKLPPICDFPIYLSIGEVKIHMNINNVIEKITDQDIKEIKKFHTFIFGDVLKLIKPFLIFDLADEDYSFYIVPVIWSEIGCMIDMNSVKNYRDLPFAEPSILDKKSLHVKDDEYLTSVVMPWYRPAESGYVVTQIRHDLNANSKFPNDNYASYASYFQDKYPVIIENPEQPLLLVKQMSQRLNCLKPRAASKNARKRKNYQLQEDFEENFIPELCVRYEFPSQLWLKANCLPSIIHRLTHLLLAEQLRQQIIQEAGLGVMSPPQEWQPLQVDKQLLDEYQPTSDDGLLSIDTVDEATHPGYKSPPGEMLDMRDLEFKKEIINRTVYPWADEQEPVDVDRHMDSVSIYELDYFDKFVNTKLENVHAETTYSPIVHTSPQKLALKYHDANADSPLKVLQIKSTNIGPQQWTVFQALTCAKANDLLNMERLETLGDSFLKFSVSLYLFLKFPELDEGKLTNIKGKVVGNRNLFYCGQNKCLGNLMKVHDFSPNNDWFPPKYCVPRFIQGLIGEACVSSYVLYQLGIPAEEQREGILSGETVENILELLSSSEDDKNAHLTMGGLLSQHIVQDKQVADCVEALIGCYLRSNGINGALKIVEWFGILPSDDNPSQMMNCLPPSAQIDKTKTINDINYLIPDWRLLEKSLGYTFKDRSYLLQALSHPSFSKNRITLCYQRLEFIGDAILDFLITCHIYEECGELTPGDMTDLRSALVNNVVFASLAVKFGFHRHLQYDTPKLNDVILEFVKHREQKDFIIDDEVLILLEESDCIMAEYVDVPKALGDVFESLAGAVFLDSGMNLEVVWSVFYKLMKPEIDKFSRNVPKNPVRMLYEKSNGRPRFSEVKRLENGKAGIELSFLLEPHKKKIVHGYGDNKKQAKRAAAKVALRAMQIQCPGNI